MSRPVDVLAVMARDAADAYCERNAGDKDWAEELGMDSTKARAAVAELIEADAAFDAATSEVSVYEALTPDHSRNYRTACYVQFREAVARRKSALARVRGAA